MSLKDNVNAIKEELSTEEQFLESVIKAEGFWKKYKKIVVTLLVVVFLAIVAKLVMDYLHESSLEKSNIAYAKLLENSDDKAALKSLKNENPRLYEIYNFQKGVKSKDIKALKELQTTIKDENLKDLLSYQIDSISGKNLSNYAMKESALVKEFAIYESAYQLLKDGKIKEANAKLDQISKMSPLYALAQNLKHYTIK